MLILLGTLLPVIGTIATIILGAVLKNTARWISLYIIPISTLAVCLLYSKELANNGNMLYAALILIYIIVVPIYYAVLIVVSSILLIKKKKSSNITSI